MLVHDDSGAFANSHRGAAAAAMPGSRWVLTTSATVAAAIDAISDDGEIG